MADPQSGHLKKLDETYAEYERQKEDDNRKWMRERISDKFYTLKNPYGGRVSFTEKELAYMTADEKKEADELMAVKEESIKKKSMEIERRKEEEKKEEERRVKEKEERAQRERDREAKIMADRERRAKEREPAAKNSETSSGLKGSGKISEIAEKTRAELSKEFGGSKPASSGAEKRESYKPLLSEHKAPVANGTASRLSASSHHSVPAAQPPREPSSSVARQRSRGIGKGTVAVAAGGLMTGLALKAKQKVRNIKDKHDGRKEYSENPGILVFLFWIAIILHIFYALIRSDILGSGAQSLLPFTRVFYGALALMAILVFTRLYGFDFVTLLICVGISAFYVFIPYINIPALSLGSITLPGIIDFLIVIVPIWPIFISTKGNFPIVSGYITIWIVFLVGLFFYKVIFATNPYDIPFTGSQQASQAGQVFTFLAEETHKVGDKIVNSIFKLSDTIQNRTGINYYMGMIEDNEEEPVGLYISKVRPAEKYFYEGSPVLIWADIRGKSLVKDSEINVTPSCYIEGKGYATVDPTRFSLLGEEYNSFLCTFSDLPKGNYRVKANAAFTFETWAYVTYTFVDIEMKRSYELQDKNINSELNIPLTPRAIYTNGPIMLGMGTGLDQPIGIDTQYNTREPILGVTIDDRWTDGVVESVSEFVIQVPNDFDLVKCDRGTPRAGEGIVSGYTSYTIRKEDLSDPRLGFQSITCRLHIKESGLKTFLSGAPKVQKTFVAKVAYLYNLQKSVSINVRE